MEWILILFLSGQPVQSLTFLSQPECEAAGKEIIQRVRPEHSSAGWFCVSRVMPPGRSLR